MTEANRAYLEQNGLKASPSAMYLAQVLGPKDATKALSQSSGRPLAKALPNVVKANPAFKDFTVGDLAAHAEKQAGEAPANPQPKVDVIGDLLERAGERSLTAPLKGQDPRRVVAIDTRMLVPPEVASDADMIDQLGSFFGRDNLVVAGAIAIDQAVQNSATFPTEKLSPQAVWDRLTDAEQVNGSDFVGASSQADIDRIRNEKEFSAHLAELSASGPINEIVGVGIASVLDPMTWIPFLGSTGKGLKFGQIAARVGGEIAISEAAFQAIQRDREVADSLAAIVVGAIAGGAIGKMLTRTTGATVETVEAAQKQYAQQLRDTAGNTDELSVGAMHAYRDPENTEAFGTFGLGALAKTLDKIGMERTAEGARKVKRGLSRLVPSYEVLSSPFPNARKWLLELTHSAVATKGNVIKGLANPENLETQIFSGRALTHRANDELNALYREAKAGGFGGSEKDFYELVGQAAHSGKIPKDPHVRKAWEWLNREVFEPLVKEADGLKLWEDLKIRFRIAPRIIDAAKLRVGSVAFDRAVAEHLIEKYSLEAGDAADAAAQIRQRYLGQPADRLPVEMKDVKISKKGRTQDILVDDIPYEVVEDFVVNDAQEMANRFIRTMTADIATKKKFGALNIEPIMEKEIREDAEKLKAAAKNDKARKSIEQQADRQIEVLRHIYRNVRGVQGRPGEKINSGLYQSAAILRNFGFIRIGGGIIFSSVFPDLAMQTFTHGLSRVLGTAVQEMANGFKGTKLSKAQQMLAGDSMDYATATNIDNLWNIGARYESGTKLDALEQATRAGAHKISKWQFLPWWNDWSKSFNGVMTTTMALDAAERVARGAKHTLNARDRIALARIGLSDEKLTAIAKEAETWQRQGSLIFANTDAWANQTLAQQFREAVSTMARNSTITPYAGDTPNLISSELGKTVFQFKKFAIAATGRITLTSAQRLRAGDMSVINGLLVLLGSGMATAMVKDMALHGEIRERTPQEWILEGIDRSGMLAPLMEMNGLSRAFIGRSIFGQPTNKWEARGRVGAIAGPTADFITGDFGNTLTSWADGKWDAKDVQQAARLIPGQNYLFIRGMLEQLGK